MSPAHLARKRSPLDSSTMFMLTNIELFTEPRSQTKQMDVFD